MDGILEYFEKEYPDLHIRDVIECGDPMTLNDLSKEYFKKQLRLHDVSQQRELLLAYHRYLTEGLSLDLHELWVDEHLKANNCG